MADNNVHLMRLEESKFYQRMVAARDLPGVDVNALETVVKLVCENVSDVTTRVTEHFGAYTLHDMTHLWNVIGIMEELIPHDVWKQPWKKPTAPLGPFQCALILMSALVHDLGMAPPEELTDKLELAEDLGQPIPNDADRDFVAYRRHYASREDDVRAIRSLRGKESTSESEKNADEKEILRRKQMIRTDYLRITHSDDTISGACRIRDWLERFQPASNYTYGNWPYLILLINVAMSHAHSGGLSWLESQLVPSLIEDMGDEKASALHAAWLLRLADILDLDASRAPSVLYRNFPPNNAISHQHWMQHLCISKRVINWEAAPPTVTFRKGDPCRNPEIYKSLTDYCGWIRDEVLKVEESQARHSSVRDQFPIRVPGSQLDDQGQPRCIQLDPNFQIEGGWDSTPIRFELSQADVVKILMGEELYGEPELCLREVTQNALDATHLRWLRYELRQRMEAKLGKDVYATYDLPPADASLNRDDLEIKVSWGVDRLPNDGWRASDDEGGDERHWIEIEDPGTGMTVDVVKKYFTQIGRSYYQSPEYRRDRALFHEYELPASEISQFGIGILSCFMLADMVEVWTCPIRPHQPTDNDKPQHYRIWGAEGLFWHQPTDAKTLPGTRIRMWLKKDITAGCNTDDLGKSLRADYYEPFHGLNKEKVLDQIDPLRGIWASVAWPRYPITFSDNQTEAFANWTLTPTSHLDQLLRINRDKVTAKLDDLTGEKLQMPLPIQWAWYDWEHTKTASRIRIAMPVTRGGDAQCRELVDLLRRLVVEGQSVAPDNRLLLPFATLDTLPTSGRDQVLIRGIRVPELAGLSDHIRITSHCGCLTVVDLSGHAAPRLRADRKTSTAKQRTDWASESRQVFTDWQTHVTKSMQPNATVARLAETTIRFSNSNWYTQTESFSDEVLVPVEVGGGGQASRWFEILILDLCLANGVNDDKWNFKNRTNVRDIALFGAGVPGRNIRSEFDTTLHRSKIGNPQHKNSYGQELALAVAISQVLELGVDGAPDSVEDFEFERFDSLRDYPRAFRLAYRSRDSNSRLLQAFRGFLRVGILPELFAGSLLNALPCIYAPIAEGRGNDGRMTSPFQLEFQLDKTSKRPPRTMPWQSGWKDAPKWLESKNYDLVAPWTHIPIGQLRGGCPTWQTERGCRALAMLPFVFSSTLLWDNYRKVLSNADEKLKLSEVTDILMLLPEESIHMLPFAKWTRPKTQRKVVTAYWKLDEDRVLWAEGFHDRSSMRKEGRTIEDILGLDT